MSDVFFLVIGILFLIIGLLFLSGVLLALVRCKALTAGKILSLKKETLAIRGSSLYSYRPVYMYEVNGTKFRGEAEFQTPSREKYKPGDPIPVHYNPKKPEECYIKISPAPVVTGGILLLIGLILVICFFL